MSLTAFHSIPSSDSASEAPLHLESDHEATDPKTSLRSAAQQNTQTQSDPARLFLLISSEVPRATHVPVLQCLTAIVINSLQPCIPTQQLVHFLRLSQSAQSVPSSRFLAHTIIRCAKTSGFASERWFSSTLQSVHNFAHNFMLKCCSFQMSSDGGSTEADQGAHREGCWFCICLGHVQKSMALQPLSTTKASCASVAQWQVPTPSSGLHYPSSSGNLKCTATVRSESAPGIRQSCWQWCHAGRHAVPRCNEQCESVVSIACCL